MWGIVLRKLYTKQRGSKDKEVFKTKMVAGRQTPAFQQTDEGRP